MRKIICTTGTSVAQGVDFQFRQEPFDEFAQAIDERLNTLREEVPDAAAFLKRVSAETNSLQCLHAGPDDQVVLLHTETTDGRICAEAVARLLEEERDCEARLIEVAGLQVRDARRFAREGILNLFAILHRECEASQGIEIVLNATGGFKSVVPYLTLYGLIYRIPVIYIFEQSNALLTLPPAPVHFDYERLSQAHDALSTLHDRTEMSKEAFFELIPGLSHNDRLWYESLLEEEGGQVMLSAFGILICEALAGETAEVRLSPSARRAWLESRGTSRQQFAFMLERVRNPLWRQGHWHAFSGTDLAVFKPRSTAERMACLLRGTKIYVCELFADHDDYERKLNGRTVADYPLSEFTTWILPVDEPVPPSSEAAAYRALLAEAEGLRKDKVELEESWSEAARQVETFQERVAQLVEDSRATMLKLEERQDEIALLEREAGESAAARASLESQLAGLAEERQLLQQLLARATRP